MLPVAVRNIIRLEAALMNLPRVFSASAASAELVKKELLHDGKIVRIVLSDAKRRNALSLELIEALHKELEAANSCDKRHVVILAAEGPAFSSGHDLKQLKASNGTQKHQEIFDKCSKMLLFIQKMQIPVIAEINGVAAAAGCQLAATCDIVIAGKSSKFAVPGAKVGLFCSTPGIALARTVPQKVALDMLLTADFIDAEKALCSGLVSRVVEDTKVEEETLKAAEKIASLSRPIVALGKQFFYSQIELSTHDAYRMGSRVMVSNLLLKDSQEGISAFVEKRKPVWTNTQKKV